MARLGQRQPGRNIDFGAAKVDGVGHGIEKKKNRLRNVRLAGAAAEHGVNVGGQVMQGTEVINPSKEKAAGEAIDRYAAASVTEPNIGKIEVIGDRGLDVRMEIDGESKEISFKEIRRLVNLVVNNWHSASLMLPAQGLTDIKSGIYMIALNKLKGRKVPEKAGLKNLKDIVLREVLNEAKAGGAGFITKTVTKAEAKKEDDANEKPGKKIRKKGKRLKVKVGVVDVSDAIEQEARERAEAALTEKVESRATGMLGKAREWFGKKFKSVWKGNLFREYYRQKEIVKAKSDIRESGSLYAGAAAEESHKKAMDSIVERFVNDYEDDVKDQLIHTEAGEKIDTLRESGEYVVIQRELNDLVKAFARGDFGEAQFNQAKKNTFNRIKQEQGEQADVANLDQVFGEGEMFADNLLEIAKQVRGLVEHGEAVEELDIEFDITIGRAKAGVRTEMQVSAVDRMTEKLTDSKLGGWLKGAFGAATTETAVATALSATYSVASTMSQSFARSKLATFGSFGATALFAGGIAAYRERKQLDRERRLHTRERAKNLEFQPGRDERREQMESFIYETRNSSDLTSQIDVLLNVEGEMSMDQQLELARLVSDADARIQISDREQIDLLSYTSTENLETERLKLDIARARGKVKMREAMAVSNPGADWDSLYSSVVDRRSLELSGDGDSEKA